MLQKCFDFEKKVIHFVQIIIEDYYAFKSKFE